LTVNLLSLDVEFVVEFKIDNVPLDMVTVPVIEFEYDPVALPLFTSWSTINVPP